MPPTLRSPSSTRSVPESASSSASAMPVRKACSASSRGQRVLDVDPARAAAHPVRGDVGGQLRRIAVQRHVDRRGPRRRTAARARSPGRCRRPPRAPARPRCPRGGPRRRVRRRRGRRRRAGRAGAMIGRTGTRPCTAASQSASSAGFPSPSAGRTSSRHRSCESRRTPASGRSTREPKSSSSIAAHAGTLPLRSAFRFFPLRGGVRGPPAGGGLPLSGRSSTRAWAEPLGRRAGRCEAHVGVRHPTGVGPGEPARRAGPEGVLERAPRL